ncbi:MAG: hypothetical protein ACXVPK_13490 [Tumebacillaceae bacterium]
MKQTEQTEKLFHGERALLISGLFGMCLGLVFGILVLVHGAKISPDGDLTKPFSFDLALGLFTVSTAAILPFANFSKRGRGVWRTVSLVTVWYSYAQESIQSLRGLNPRFTRFGTPIDGLLGAGFGLVSLTIIVLYVILAIKLFRAHNTRQLMTLGIRYGMVAALLGFTAGLWMIALQGRYTGPTGNIIWLHGLAFHGLQAAPLIAWLLERSALEKAKAHKLLHTGGLVYLLLILLVAGQTILGRSLLEVAPFPLAALATLLLYLGLLASAISHGLNGKKGQKSNTTAL